MKKSKKPIYERILPPQILLPFAIAGTIIIIVSAYLEYSSRYDDYILLLDRQTAGLTQTIINTAQSTFKATEELEREINKNIYDNLRLVDRIDRLSSSQVELAGSEMPGDGGLGGGIPGDFDEIRFYDKNFGLEQSILDSEAVNVEITEAVLRRESGDIEERTPVVVNSVLDFDETYLAAIIPRSRGGAIVGIISFEEIGRFRSLFGFGQLLRTFYNEENVEYIALENEQTIIAGFFEGYSLTPLLRDEFLSIALENSTADARTLSYPNGDIYESVAPFKYDGETVGLLRIGLSMNDLDELMQRAYRRMSVFAGLIFVVGMVLVNFILSYRHRQLLRKELSYVSEYTNAVLENLESGVITFDNNGLIKVINKRASLMTGLEYSEAFGQSFTILPSEFAEKVRKCLNSEECAANRFEYNYSGSTEQAWLAFRSARLDKKGETTLILLIDDVTKDILHEEQKQANSKLIAMRKLASGIAHEIRNPLNSINLIVDLLKLNYTSEKEKEKQTKYITTVQGEISRISTIVEEFLRFARPPELQIAPIDFKKFSEELSIQYSQKAENAGLRFVVNSPNDVVFNGDTSQLKQVLVNLIENAIQASESGGRISVSGNADSENFEIIVSDTGKGISPNDHEQIFDLYYTTKKTGSGIGLAVVQQIISRHQGTITVESEPNTGTTFKIKIPQNLPLSKKLD